MSGNYPPGVSDDDPHFDMPSILRGKEVCVRFTVFRSKWGHTVLAECGDFFERVAGPKLLPGNNQLFATFALTDCEVRKLYNACCDEQRIADAHDEEEADG